MENLSQPIQSNDSNIPVIETDTGLNTEETLKKGINPKKKKLLFTILSVTFLLTLLTVGAYLFFNRKNNSEVDNNNQIVENKEDEVEESEQEIKEEAEEVVKEKTKKVAVDIYYWPSDVKPTKRFSISIPVSAKVLPRTSLMSSRDIKFSDGSVLSVGIPHFGIPGVSKVDGSFILPDSKKVYEVPNGDNSILFTDDISNECEESLDSSEQICSILQFKDFVVGCRSAKENYSKCEEAIKTFTDLSDELYAYPGRGTKSINCKMAVVPGSVQDIILNADELNTVTTGISLFESEDLTAEVKKLDFDKYTQIYLSGHVKSGSVNGVDLAGDPYYIGISKIFEYNSEGVSVPEANWRKFRFVIHDTGGEFTLEDKSTFTIYLISDLDYYFPATTTSNEDETENYTVKLESNVIDLTQKDYSTLDCGLSSFLNSSWGVAGSEIYRLKSKNGITYNTWKGYTPFVLKDTYKQIDIFNGSKIYKDSKSGKIFISDIEGFRLELKKL